jgi:hypothetical protein
MKRKVGFLNGIVLIVLSLLGLTRCEKRFDTEYERIESNYKTENIIVVIIDGPRFSETWGHPKKQYVPFLAKRLATKGIINQEFYNFGNTQTISGHTATITGVYEIMNNNGLQYPANPSFMQYWLAATKNSPEKAWIISSKKKLSVVGNSSNLNWRNSYLPSVDAENRSDLLTFDRIKSIMTDKGPNLIFINLSEPDRAGHQNNWNKFLEGIILTDSLLNEVVILADSLPQYKGKTTIFMTNDHGRHLDGIASGFKDHGDKCHGCTHLNFFAYGPDFHSNLIINNQLREQIDIVPTIGHLLGIQMEHPEGKIMTELFK